MNFKAFAGHSKITKPKQLSNSQILKILHRMRFQIFKISTNFSLVVVSIYFIYTLFFHNFQFLFLNTIVTFLFV